MLRRYHLLLEALLTRHSSLTQQVKKLSRELAARQQKLAINATAVERMIPQVVWAVTEAAHDFFNTTTAKEDLLGEHPEQVTAGLTVHTTMFTSGVRHEIESMPLEWRTSPKKPHLPVPKRGRPDDDGPGPAPKKPATPKPNNDGPPAFAKNRELDNLLRQRRDLRLTDICKAAGYENTGAMLRAAGVTTDKCLNYNAMGFCANPSCGKGHSNVSNDDASKMASTLQPGITALLRDGDPGGRRNGRRGG